MAAIRIHLDVVDQAATTTLSEAAGREGFEVILGAPGAVPPDILVTRAERIGRHPCLSSRADLQPQLLLWAFPGDVTSEDLLGVRVTAFLPPTSGKDEIARVFAEAAQVYRSRRQEFAMWHEMEERYAEATVIVNLALELEPGMGIDDVLERIVIHLSEDLGYSIVSIMLLDDDEKHLTIRAARGLSARIIEITRMEVGKGVSGTVALTGEPLLVQDVEADARFGKPQSHKRYSSKSLICVPLKVGDRVIGVINANNKWRDEPLGDYDLHILTVVAAHISVSIERTRLYHNLERKAVELREAYEKLQAIDRIKSDFIINVSHEYRTPVTIILGYLELLKGSLADATHIDKVNVIMEAASRLSSLIDDSTDLLRLDTGTTLFIYRDVGVDYFLEEAVRGQWGRFGNKGVDLSLDLPEGLPLVRVDPDKMIKVFEKLLDNALKFTPQGGYTRVTARSEGDSKVLIQVEDSGAGISLEDRSRIFDRFEQGGDIMTGKPEGTGLGLTIAGAIMARQGGDISLDEQFDEGCRIIITLPVAENTGP
ncbi:MAG: GAF domain-containing sensor histidine kinase [bacterium]|nr:GAF domain-containing sensor histidine kinase [bacterium]MDT8396012.1 GAF domain-containing sensor histidine kinase [bacterium]